MPLGVMTIVITNCGFFFTLIQAERRFFPSGYQSDKATIADANLAFFTA
ncbi:hypothetical protein Y888_01330 [Mixta calida B021323]|nr:hypothetical protein Y888_01330 [Mixta calida B021323]